MVWKKRSIHHRSHEIITNAVLHRDYSVADDVHIRIFDNRVEVVSPGMLPAHITPENILSERFARNAAIVRLINKFPDLRTRMSERAATLLYGDAGDEA